MLAYNVHLPTTFQVARDDELFKTGVLRTRVTKTSYLVRTLDQARRLSAVLGDAPIGLINVTEHETIEYLLSPEAEADLEDFIAFRSTGKRQGSWASEVTSAS